MKGYFGRLLRVDLSDGRFSEEEIPGDVLRRFIGGVGLGAWYLWREVPPDVDPLSAENRLYLFAGPLSGTRAPGSGGSCCVTKSPYTDLAGSTQANGYLGAYFRSQGFDGLIFQGASPGPVIFFLDRDGPSLLPAEELRGLTTGRAEKAVKEKIGLKGLKSSVYTIGPAGENLVRFAVLIGDGGHAFGHNGVGAVLGAKQLKAIAVARGRRNVSLYDPRRFEQVAKEMKTKAADYMNGNLKKYGTAGLVSGAAQQGILPVRNISTSIFPEADRLDGRNLRRVFPNKPKTCYQCPVAHNRIMKVTEGPFAGIEVKEPEYELLAALGSNLGLTDPGSVMYLADRTNQLGLNGTEAGWILSWVTHAAQEGLLGPDDLGGIEPSWGDAESAGRLLEMIVEREGLGDVFALGIKNAAEALGGEVKDLAVYTQKGASPRGHDHRGRWTELFDTCTSNTGTIEATFGPRWPAQVAPPVEDAFDHLEVARANARANGWRQFEDTLGLCRFCTNGAPAETAAAFGAATGLPGEIPFGQKIGRRIVNLLRVFNLKAGLNPARERPSVRYGSVPADGPAQGRDIMACWDEMLRTYYEGMGWDESGRPTRETLVSLDLEEAAEPGAGEA